MKNVPDIGDCALLGFKVLCTIVLSTTAAALAARYLGFIPESWFHPGDGAGVTRYQSALFAGVTILSFPVGWTLKKLKRPALSRD